MRLILLRDLMNAECSLGVLTGGRAVLQSLELPWIPDPASQCGKPMVSCLPFGDYNLVPHDTVKHPKTWALVAPALGVYHEPGDVPPGCIARTACLIHPANFTDELEGCIGVGQDRARYGTGFCVTHSQDAFAMLRAAVPWMPGHTISIIDGRKTN